MFAGRDYFKLIDYRKEGNLGKDIQCKGGTCECCSLERRPPTKALSPKQGGKMETASILKTV
jgi:hypothetical protein